MLLSNKANPVKEKGRIDHSRHRGARWSSRHKKRVFVTERGTRGVSFPLTTVYMRVWAEWAVKGSKRRWIARALFVLLPSLALLPPLVKRHIRFSAVFPALHHSLRKTNRRTSPFPLCFAVFLPSLIISSHHDWFHPHLFLLPLLLNQIRAKSLHLLQPSSPHALSTAANVSSAKLLPFSSLLTASSSKSNSNIGRSMSSFLRGASMLLFASLW